jgi:hypothetical protein
MIKSHLIQFKKASFYMLFITLILPETHAISRYLTLDRQLYRNYEYQYIMADKLSIFVMNQPYLATDPFLIDKNNSYRAKTISQHEGISVLVKPGWQFSGISDMISNPSVFIDGYFMVDDLIGVNQLYASKQLSLEKDYHGDTNEWISAYMFDAYARYTPSPALAFFGGRTARNYGIPNEFGLFLSDNPYPFDHYGFSATGNKIQFSWYFGRLNDLLGKDDQGITIPFGESQLAQRYLSFQRLDWKVNERLQLGLSEATLFGGPNQVPVAAYLNPLNFNYLSQRNQNVQMNGSWQVNIFFYKPKMWAYYLDFYIDDFIINNDEGVDDRAVHPDRLAIMTKISLPDFLTDQTLTSLRYVRIWNETYVSYRDYENWVYFDKGLGFPYRSYEGIKFESSFLGSNIWQMTLSIEGWRRGDRSLYTTLIDDAVIPFPARPVTNGVTTQLNLRCNYKKVDYNLNIRSELLSFKKNIESSTFGVNLSVSYIINTGTGH